MEAIFTNIQNALISRILGVFLPCLLHRISMNKYEVHFLIRLREFYFLTKSDDFAKAIAFAWRPFLGIIKIVSFLEY